MKRNFICSVIFSLIACFGFAQIPNPGFELLDSTNALRNWFYTGAISITMGDSIVYDGPLVSKSSTARTGNYALELRNSYNYTTGGPFMNGTAMASIPDNSVYQGFNEMIPMTGHPIGLDFYYKFSRNPFTDSTVCTVKLFNSAGFEIASGAGRVWTVQSSYQLKTVNLNYLSTIPPGNGDSIPAFTTIEFRNKMSAGAPHIGQRTLIDDVSFRFSTVGIAEEAGISDISVFPNPVHERLQIRSESSLEIEIYNAIGQSVLKTEVSNIDVSSMQPGIYFIKIGQGDQLQVKKIVIE
jgi:hypothetical protein